MTDLWHRLVGRLRRDAIQREVEKEHMSPAERRIAEEPIEDLQAERFAEEHFGNIDPDRLEE